MKRYLQFTILFALLFLLLSACAPLNQALGNPPTQAPLVTAQPVITQTTLREAQVVSIDIQITQAGPVLVNALVRGNLSESCATLIAPQVSYASGTFQIKLLASSPTDRGCLQVITPFEQTISLDVASLTPGSYTVVANGVSAVFTLPLETTPSEPGQVVNSFELVYYDSNHNIQVVSPSFPADIVLDPYFNGMLPIGGSANGTVYVLDSTNGTKVVAVGERGVGTLDFIGRPASYGLAVFPGDAVSQARLAWGTVYSQKIANSTLEISNLDGSGAETLLTQEVSDPLVQFVPEFWSPDGQALYFSKEPVGIGGYILFGGASNLYKIDVNTKVVTELIPLDASTAPQACLDALSADYRYVADHCTQNTISIHDLVNGTVVTTQPPAELSGYKFVGSTRFSPDGSRIAFAVAKGDQANEQGWVAVSDTAASNAKVILTSSVGSYYTVAGWLNNETLVVQTTSVQDCSPYCASELWIVGMDGSHPQKVADGSFIAYLPGGKIAGPLPTAQPLPTAVANCTDAAEYVGDDGLDGTTYTPNTAFTKTWTVKNTGTCTWDNTYMVYQLSGEFMTQQPGYWLVKQGQTVQPGQSVDVSVGMTSPVENGNYRSYWVIKDSQGQVVSLKGGTAEDAFYVDLNVDDGTATGSVTSTAIDIVQEQGSGEACTAGATYFVHATISADGPTKVSYEIGSSAGQISAGYFEVHGNQSAYVTGTLKFDQAGDKTIDLRFVGPYPYPDNISVMLRVNGGDWVSTRLACP